MTILSSLSLYSIFPSLALSTIRLPPPMSNIFYSLPSIFYSSSSFVSFPSSSIYFFLYSVPLCHLFLHSPYYFYPPSLIHYYAFSNSILSFADHIFVLFDDAILCFTPPSLLKFVMLLSIPERTHWASV